MPLGCYLVLYMQVERGQAYIKSEAVLRIAQQLNMPLALLAGLAFLVPKPAADVLYDQVGLAASFTLSAMQCEG
jgi:predicted DCC family thiol-disulfide oxidoreductase YuxK